MKTFKVCTSVRRSVLLLFIALVFSTFPFLNKAGAQTLQVINSMDNDAFLDISWDLPASCFTDPSTNRSYRDGVYLELLANGELILGQVIDTETPEVVQDTFRHFAGPSANVTYTLNLYEQGPGDLITGGCSGQTATGQTLSFQEPNNITVSTNFAEKIRVTWQNNSRLSTNYFLVRKRAGEEVIAGVVPGTTMPGEVVEFEDVFDFNDTTSLVNGFTYEYCIRTFSTLADSIFDEDTFSNICISGATTYDIGATASLNTFQDKVELNWNDLSEYADQIIIRRNGVTLTRLEPNITSFTDILPVYGFESNYGVVLVKNRLSIVQDTTRGGVLPRGAISGFVRDMDGIGIASVIVEYSTTVFDQVFTGRDTTDFTGAYSFDSLFYGIESDFSVRVIPNRPDVRFEEEQQIVNLSNGIPQVENIDFEADINLKPSTDTIDIATFNPVGGIDTVAANFSINTSADTLYLQLYREGNLIDFTDNASGGFGTLSDRGGKAREDYKYTLVAYAIREDSAVVARRDTIITFPNVDSVSNLAATDNFDQMSMGAITLTWDHASDNFAAFRIYRDSVVIAQIDTSARNYTDYEGEPGVVYDYGITAVRFINDEIFESSIIQINNVMYPEFPEVMTVTAQSVDAANAVDLSWTLVGAGADDDNFTGFKIYREGEEIDEVLVGSTFEYRDLGGVPGQSYRYSVAPFVENIDTVFIGLPVESASTPFPDLDAPTGLAVNNTGKCRLNASWSENYNLLSFSNFDGFIVYVDDVAVDTLPPFESSYTYYTTSDVAQEIAVSAFRRVDGTIYEAKSAGVSGTAQVDPSALEMIGGLKVSKDVSPHVALTWDYPVYKFSEYIIRRNGLLLDTLPKGARGYYDYSAEVGVEYEYSVQTTYTNPETNTTTRSKEVFGQGLRRNKSRIFGQIFSPGSNGKTGENLEVLLLNGDTTMMRTFTDSAGFFKFEHLPPLNHQNDLKVEINQLKKSLFIVDSVIDISQAPLLDTFVNLAVVDSFMLPAFPPRPLQDSLASIAGFSLQTLESQHGVLISWTPNDGRYDGVEVYRAVNLIGTITTEDDFNFLIDSVGTGNIVYDYLLSPFYIDENGETIKDNLFKDTLKSISFAELPPVSNLTASAGYSGNDNSVTLNWSHVCDGDINFYEVTRNDEIIATVSAGDSLTFEDRTGVPDNLYTYGVTAYKVLPNGLLPTETQEVVFRYPAVEDPFDFLATPVQDSNAVLLTWEYNGTLVDGFRIFRDQELLATIDEGATTSFFDFTGLPDTTHQYRIVAALEREDVTYRSVGAVAEATYPQIAPVKDLSITPNFQKGLNDVFFVYEAPGVDSFITQYNITYTPENQTTPVTETTMFGIPATDLAENDTLSVQDIFGPSGSEIEYIVFAVSNREGIRYTSPVQTTTVTYPNPPVPINAQASQGEFENSVLLTWELPFDANIEQFEIVIDGTTKVLVDEGVRRYRHVVNEIGNSDTKIHTYSIRSVRFIFDEPRFSTSTPNFTGFARIDRTRENSFEEVGLGALGYSVAVDKNEAVAGAPSSNVGVSTTTRSGRVLAFTYDSVTDQWDQSDRISATGNRKLLGQSVALEDQVAAVGAPGSGASSEIGAVGIVKRFHDNNSASTVTTFNDLSNNFFPFTPIFANNRYGDDVAIASGSSNFHVAYSAFKGQVDLNFFGVVFDANVYHLKVAESEASAFSSATEAKSLGNDPIAVAAAGNYFALGFNGYVELYTKDSDNGFAPNEFVRFPPTNALGGGFGADVALTTNYLVVGSPTDGGGSISIYKRVDQNTLSSEADERTASYELVDEVELPSVNGFTSSAARFGTSVAIDGNIIVVGAPEHTDPAGSGQATGLVFVYEIDGDIIRLIDWIPAPDAAANDDFGFDVDITTDHIIIGAPEKNMGSGKVYFYGTDLVELWGQKITNVQATDGTIDNQVAVSWDFSGNFRYVDGFNIYRNNERIGQVGPSSNLFFDSEGKPGEIYTYRVSAYVGGRESVTKADSGFKPGDGEIRGRVTTLMGNSPVPNVMITAEGIVDGQKYVYTGLTNNDGSFIFPTVVIGDSIGEYTVRAGFEDHVFVQDTFNVSLTEQSPVQEVSFLDRTAFVISGTVAYEDVICGIDSVTVTVESIFEDGNITMDSSITNEDGFYSVVIDPTADDLQEIRVQISDASQKTNPMRSVTERIRHEFRAEGPTSFTSFDLFPQATTLDFTDTLTYEVELFVTTVCGGAASNGNFSIEVSTKDGCYSEQFTTTTGGIAKAKLPPLDDFSITVRDVQQKNINNLLIVDYLKFRPDTLSLRKIHVANFPDTLTEIELEELVDRDLVYHRPADIQLTTPFPEYFCDDSEVGIIRKDDGLITMRFNVTEQFGDLSCRVNEGFIVVNNAAADKNSLDTLRYNDTLGIFPPHLFRAGLPNLVAPFRKGISVKYFSAKGDLLSDIIYPVIVLGTNQLPGADIVVDLSDPDGQLKLPTIILRDPPGDGSSASITSGTTITRSYERDESTRGGAGVLATFQGAFFSIGAFADVSLLAGETNSGSAGFELSTNVSETISTSSTSDFTGERADIIAGVGSAIAYSINEQLVYDENACTLNKQTRFAFGTNGIETQWRFTVGQIQLLVNQLREDSVNVRNDNLIIYENGTALDKIAALARIGTRINNWEEVLKYHRESSVPHIAFCREELNVDEIYQDKVAAGWFEYFPDVGLISLIRETSGAAIDRIDDNAIVQAFSEPGALNSTQRLLTALGPPSFFEERINNARTAQNAFCTQIGTGRGSNFVPNDDISWSNDLVQDYETAVSSVALWVDSLQFRRNSDVESKVGALNSNSPSFLPQVVNYTFSGGTETNVQETSTQTRSSSHSQEVFVDFSTSFGLYFKVKASISTGLFVSLTNAITDTEAKIGAQVEVNYTTSETIEFAREEETSVEYTLTDDEPGDQFSVTVFKPVLDGHGPYFELLGGRSQCPPEEGTIYRDRIKMAIFDTLTQSTFDFFPYQDLSPDEPLIVYLQISNETPFAETKDAYIYSDTKTNLNGASVRLNGRSIEGGNQGGGLTITNIPPNEPFVIPVEITRSRNAFVFDDINIIIRPSCTDGDLFINLPADGSITPDTVTIRAEFDSPCTDLTLGAPDSDWLITRKTAPNDREDLVVEVLDYDPLNEPLQDILLQYRGIGDGSGWTNITPLEIRVPEEENRLPGYDYPISKDSLQVYNDRNFAADAIPKLIYTWDITDDFVDDDVKYPDGIYEIRAVARCGTIGNVTTDPVRGRIIRNSSGGIFTQFSPSDRVFSIGDEVSFTLNKPLSCNDVNASSNVLTVRRKSDGAIVPGSVGCFENLDKLVFRPAGGNFDAYDGDTLVATLSNIIDENNLIYDTVFTEEFLVLTRNLFVQDQVIEATVYKDAITPLATRVFPNSAANISISSVVSDEPWLTEDPTGPNPRTVFTASAGEDYRFLIDASTLEVGDTTATVTITSESAGTSDATNTITFRIKVVASPPNWIIDPSQFTSSMLVVSNYRFTNGTEDDISVDTMDLVAAFIDNEIRGVSKINRTDQGQFAAPLVIYGNRLGKDDSDQPIEFRIWDAQPGREYNSSYFNSNGELDTIKFASNTRRGSFTDPEILVVDPAKDRARFIPLNGNGAWTWFSVNSQEEDMRLNNVLRELKNAKDGDIIYTRNGAFASYVEATDTWVGSSELDTIFPELAYRIYLTGADDTIRITGQNAEFGAIDLVEGFNLFGYPLQDSADINVVLKSDPTAFSGLTNGDFLQTTAQDPDKSGLSTNMAAFYDGSTGEWTGVGGADQMRPFFGYRITINNPAGARLIYPGATTGKSADLSAVSGYKFDRKHFMIKRELAEQAEADKPQTWEVDPAKYPDNMIITARLSIDETISIDPNDKVAAFVDGESRGYTQLRQFKGVDGYYAVLFVYGASAGEEVDFRIYDADTDRMLFATERMAFEPGKLIGSIGEPYIFQNKTFKVAYQTAPVPCELERSGVATISDVEGMTAPLSYQWSNGAATASVEGLEAGTYKVTITDADGYWVVQELEIENLAIELPTPTVDLIGQQVVCANDRVELKASVADAAESLTYKWYNGRNKLLSEGNSYIIEAIDQTQDIYVESASGNCSSERVHYTLEVNDPYATFRVNPEAEVKEKERVSLTLNEIDEQYNYSWDMGDGTILEGQSPVHKYKEEGIYFINLTIKDELGCTNIIPAAAPVQVLAKRKAVSIIDFNINATPNPFVSNFVLSIQAPKPGTYDVRMRDAQGRLVWSNAYDLTIGTFDLNIDATQIGTTDGVYFIEVEEENGNRKLLKVIKAKP